MPKDAIPKIPPAERSQIKILAVDESLPRLELLVSSLKNAGYSHVHSIHNPKMLLELVRGTTPDIILIEVESPSRDTLEQLTLIRDQAPTPVLIVAQDPQAQSIHDAVASGVCAYSVGGVSAASVKPAIEVAMATFAKFKALRDQLAEVRLQLQQQKRIDRAKCILIQQKGLTEEQAHQALRKLAMDRKRKLVDVADDLIAISKLL